MASMIDDYTYPAFEWTFCAAAIVVTCGRYCIRWHYFKTAKLDDLFNGLALISLIALIAMDYVSYYSPDEVIMVNTTLAADILLWTTLYFVKATFLVLIRSIFNVSARSRRVWWVVTVYTVISFLGCIIAELWICGAPWNFGNFEICWNSSPSPIEPTPAMFKLIFHISSDILILALPMFHIRHLQMSLVKKISVAAVFALTIFDIIGGVIRNASAMCLDADDMNNVCLDITIIGFVLEPSVAVIVCALPAYGAMLLSSRKRRNESPDLRRNAANMGHALPKRSQSIQTSEDIGFPMVEPGLAHVV